MHGGASASASGSDLVGRVLLGKLRVDARLGEGGMGTVYRVTHLGTRHERALKVLRPELGVHDEALVRFTREAGVSGVLRSPYVVETLDTGQLDDGSTYVLMELLDGQPLSSVIARGPMPAPRIARLLAQACEGLARAHDEGIVHRDLKPDNLFVVIGEDGKERIKILDFGIARFVEPKDFAGHLTTDRAVLGTPFYMAPEQLGNARHADARSDVYALGVILYEALSGVRPFDADSFGELLIRVHEARCEPLERVAPGLDARAYEVVARAMARSPDARPQTARALGRELVRLIDATDVDARVDPLAGTAMSIRAPASDVPRAGSELRPPTRSRAPWIAIALVAVVALAGLGAWALSGAGPVAIDPAPRAEVEPARPVREPARVEPARVEPARVEPARPEEPAIVPAIVPRVRPRRGALAGPDEILGEESP